MGQTIDLNGLSAWYASRHLFHILLLIYCKVLVITTADSPSDAIQWLAQNGHERLVDATPGTRFQCSQPWQSAALEQQMAFRKRTRRRYPRPEQWLWTDRSLAQASDWWSAEFKASLFPAGVTVVDGCCGAGVDAVALAARGPVIGIDIDPDTATLAAANLSASAAEFRSESEIRIAAIPETIPDNTQWLHVDPDRRPTDRKTRQADQFSPPLGAMMEVCSSTQGACIKTAPSTLFEPQVEDQLDDDNVQRVWLGSFAECRQQLLLWGQTQLSQEHPRWAILSHPQPAKFGGDAETEVDIIATPGSFVFDLHSALHASELQECWADQHDMSALGGEHGYFTADQAVDSPWAQAFEVIDILAWDDRKLRKWLRGQKARQVEVKNRNFKLDASSFQRRYSKPDGQQDITLLVTQLGPRVKAIACRRV